MANKIQLKRGIKSRLSTLSAGEPAFTTDTRELFVGTGSGNVNMSGNKWYNGTALSGTSTSTTYTYSACPLVKLGDMYINTTTGGIYECTTAGSGTSAKWTYRGSIKGPAADESDFTATQNDLIMYVCAIVNTMSGNAKTSFANHIKSVLSSNKYNITTDVAHGGAADLFGYVSLYDGDGSYTLPEDKIIYIELSSIPKVDSFDLCRMFDYDTNQQWDFKNPLTNAEESVSISATAFALRIKRDKCYLVYVW